MKKVIFAFFMRAFPLVNHAKPLADPFLAYD